MQRAGHDDACNPFCAFLRGCPCAQEGYPEAVKSAAVEQPDGSSTQPKAPKQDARAASEEARAVGLGLRQTSCRAEGGAGGSEIGDVQSGSISNAGEDTTGDGRAGVMEGSSTADASAAPSSISRRIPEQWTDLEASRTYMHHAGEADSGWARVKPSRRRARRQAENAAPARLCQTTASAAVPLMQPLPSSSASGNLGPKARSPQALECKYGTQVRHWDHYGASTSVCMQCTHHLTHSEGQRTYSVQATFYKSLLRQCHIGKLEPAVQAQKDAHVCRALQQTLVCAATLTDLRMTRAA